MSGPLVAGWGHAGAAEAGELLAALAAALERYGRSLAEVAATAAPEGKETLAAAVAQRLGLPLVIVPMAALRNADGLLTRSERSLAATGAGSAAEAAALVAAGAGAALIGPRVAHGRATCALAQRGGGA